MDDDFDDDSEGDDYESEVSCEDDFDECELEHNQAFTHMRRIGCFTHTLQLVALNFDNYVGFKELLKRTHDLIRKVNSSTKATERLINACGKKLLKNCPTRWNSSFLMIERLLNV